MKNPVDEASNRSALRRLHLHDPLWILAFVSFTAAVVAVVLVQPWRESSPFRTKEILVVPALAASFLLPLLTLARLVPSTAYARAKVLQSAWLPNVVLTASAVILVTGLIWSVFGVLLDAKWGIIDDHEIMFLLGPRGKLNLADLPSRLALTEVGHFGISLRYRPAYYTLRLLETVLWGGDPKLWYAARIAMITSGALLFWLLAKRVMGAHGAALLVAYALSIPIWADTVGRLGPSEAYAVLGLPLFLLGAFQAHEAGRIAVARQVLPAILILVGGVICVGSKENFLILALPAAYLVYISARRRNWLVVVAACIVLVCAAAVAGSVLIATSRTGVDVYGRSTSLFGRVEQLGRSLLERRFVSPLTMLVGITAALGALLICPGIQALKRRAIRIAIFWMGALCLVYLSESVFHSSDWPTQGSHYDFPGMLYLPGAIVVLFWLGIQLLAGVGQEDRARIALGLSTAIALAVAIVYHGGVGKTIESLKSNVSATIEFTTRLERLASELRREPDRGLVVEGSGDIISDYEPIFALARFLRAYQVVNPLFARIHGYSSRSFEPGFRQRLAHDLEELSTSGSEFYSSLGELEEGREECTSLFLGAVHPTSCSVFE